MSSVIYSSCKKEPETVTVTNTVTVRDTVVADLKTKVIGATFDATIKSDFTNGTLDSNYASGAGEILAVGASGDGEVKLRTLIQFDLSSIPSGATISSARLTFEINKVGNNVSQIYVHRLTEAWEKGSVTDDAAVGSSNDHSDIGEEINTPGTAAVTWMFSNYSTLQKWSIAGGSMAAASDSSNSKYSNTLSFGSPGIAKDVQDWLNSTNDNFGWILKYNSADESSTEYGRLMRYISAEGGASKGAKPKLIVTYTE